MKFLQSRFKKMMSFSKLRQASVKFKNIVILLLKEMLVQVNALCTIYVIKTHQNEHTYSNNLYKISET